jgi:hypothetical protein
MYWGHLNIRFHRITITGIMTKINMTISTVMPPPDIIGSGFCGANVPFSIPQLNSNKLKIIIKITIAIVINTFFIL